MASDAGQPSEWVARGERDLTRARVLLDADDPEGVSFHLQQAVEKFLKGFLLSKGWRLKRTHDLAFLLEEAHRHEPSLDAYRDLCITLSQIYLSERYPNSHGYAVDRGKAEDYIRQAVPLFDFIRGHLKT